MMGDRGRGADRGVSPVIGVVLIVAITVLLATTAGYLVFGFADDTSEKAPQIAITTTYDQRTSGDGQSLEIEFESGDTVAERDAKFVLQDAVTVHRPSGSESSAVIDGNQIQGQVGSEVAAGEEMVVDASSTTVDTTNDEYLDLSDATVRLVLDPASPDVQQSETIWRWTPQ